MTESLSSLGGVAGVVVCAESGVNAANTSTPPTQAATAWAFMGAVRLFFFTEESGPTWATQGLRKNGRRGGGRGSRKQEDGERIHQLSHRLVTNDTPISNGTPAVVQEQIFSVA